MRENKFVLLLLFILLSCADNNSVDQEELPSFEGTLAKLYPYDSNLNYEFSIDTLNSDNTFSNIGTRTSKFQSKLKVGEYDYFNCLQFHKFETLELELQSMFRKSDNIIYLLTDTSKVSELFPDSLKNIVKIIVEDELNLLQLPLEFEQKWPVVKAYVDYQSFKFNTVDVEAEYLGSESVLLDGFNEAINVVRVKYKLDVNVPNLDNPFLAQTISYYADLWFSENYGIVKMEGCSFMLNMVVGYPMDFKDIEQVSRQTLIKVY